MDVDQDLLNSFFSDVEDYYEAINTGLKLVRSDQASAGIDVMMRPLHSIKGTSGFIGGLEDISTFTHKVEDYLKDIQNKKIPITSQSTDLLAIAVDMVFDLIEQMKNSRKINDSNSKDILLQIKNISQPGEREIDVENKNGISFIRINMKRVHLPGQYREITGILDQIKSNDVVIDLSKVSTVGSTAWGAIWAAGHKMNISIIGMNDICRTIFTTWAFDTHINVFDAEEEFWENKKGDKT